MTEDYRIGIVGAAGRMGRMLVRAVTEADGCVLGGAVDRPGAPGQGEDAGTLAGVGALGVAVVADAVPMFADTDAVIEFSTPEATVEHAGLAAQARCVYVAGTTGLDKDQQAALDRAARHTQVVWAPNMSLGVNLLIALTEQVARTLADDYDIEIVEMHHRHKVDAPSGTALGLGRAAAAGRGVDLDTVQELGRAGPTGARERGRIGFAALRGGDVVGDHTVIFATDGERIELTHKAANREIYARGAVRSALWARDKPPGLYGMRDILGLGA